MSSRFSRSSSYTLWLGAAALAASLLACSFSAGSGSTDRDPAGSPGTLPTATSQAGPAGATFELADPSADCFSGISRTLSDCRGLDMTGLFVGLPADMPGFNDEPAMAGRVGFVLTFAGDLAGIESFGLCLWLDIDRNASTGNDYSGGWGGIPGVDRGVCVDLPEGKTHFYLSIPAQGALDPVYDDSVAIAVVKDDAVGIAIAPSLLADASGATPAGFNLFVETARSIDPLDNFNDQGTLWQSQLIAIPDEVVTQALP